jgi:hypothetical protein
VVLDVEITNYQGRRCAPNGRRSPCTDPGGGSGTSVGAFVFERLLVP